MATCPDCGSVIMEGDPYCEHCGAHLIWDYDDEEDDYENRRTSKPHFLDYGKVSETYYRPDDETLERIAGSVCLTSSQKMELKAKIRQYMKAADYQGFYIRKEYGFEVYYFNFIQENEYVKTTHVMTFIQDPDYSSPYKIFYESHSEHNHEKLLENPRFKRMIESTCLEFSGCGGGYRPYLKEIYTDVTLTGKIDIQVYFNVNDKRRQYQLDLDNMRLSSEYNEYEI